MNTPVAPIPALPGLLAWPQQVPTAVARVLADAHMALAFERGAREEWTQWQRQRLGALLQWLAPQPAWQRWLAPLAGDPRPFEVLAPMRPADYRALLSATPHVPPGSGRVLQIATSDLAGASLRVAATEQHLRLVRGIDWADHERQGRRLDGRYAVLGTQLPKHAGEHLEPPADAWLQPGPHFLRHAPSFTAAGHARWLGGVAPDYLVTEAATLAALLDAIEREGLDAPPIAQVAVVAGAVHPDLRARTRRVLGARIAARWGWDAIGPLAFQCPLNDAYMHASVANAVLEVTDDDGRLRPSGGRGRVLVTGLHQWAHAALRYDTGAYALLHAQCPACGAQVPTLEGLEVAE